MDIGQLQQIVTTWASQLPYKVNVYLFGSRLKGTARDDSDLDIAIEFLEIEEAWLLWFSLHEKWQSYLSHKVGLKVHLELYEGNESEHLKAYLNDASMLLYSPGEQ